MAWIARDKDGENPYRIFGKKPVLLRMVTYDGEVSERRRTWTVPPDPGVTIGGRRSGFLKSDPIYGPLSNDEPTEIAAADSPIELEPGEGPIEVRLSLVRTPEPRPFEGAGI